MELQTPYELKYTVTCDWFECFLKGNPIKADDTVHHHWFDKNRICFISSHKKSPAFRQAYEVWIDGVQFGHLQSNPTNTRIIKADMMQFKVQNERLYEALWTNQMEYFLNYFNYKVSNITRLDIALDGHGFLDVANRWHDREFECVSTAEFKPDLNRKMRVKSYHFGGITSDRNLKCYNKSSEIEHSNKNYIAKYWERSGLNTSKPVERLELSMRNDMVKTLHNFDWKQADNFEYLASMMRTVMHGFYQFAFPIKKQAIKHQPRFDFIDWHCIGGVLLERNEAMKPTDANMLKQAAKTDYFIYKQTGENIYLEFSREKAINANCIDWFIRKVEEWDRDFERRRGNNADGLVTIPYITSFSKYRHGEQILIFND